MIIHHVYHDENTTDLGKFKSEAATRQQNGKSTWIHTHKKDDACVMMKDIHYIAGENGPGLNTEMQAKLDALYAEEERAIKRLQADYIHQ